MIFLETILNIFFPTDDVTKGTSFERLSWETIQYIDLSEEAITASIPVTGAGRGLINYSLTLSNETSQFLRKNFNSADYHCKRESVGFYTGEVSISFRNPEDAMAFKLRWS